MFLSLLNDLLVILLLISENRYGGVNQSFKIRVIKKKLPVDTEYIFTLSFISIPSFPLTTTSGSVSLFNGISTFVGYLMLKQSP